MGFTPKRDFLFAVVAHLAAARGHQDDALLGRLRLKCSALVLGPAWLVCRKFTAMSPAPKVCPTLRGAKFLPAALIFDDPAHGRDLAGLAGDALPLVLR